MLHPTRPTTPEEIDSIGGNPHAEPPAPIEPAISWREQPMEWTDAHASTPTDAHDALSALLDSIAYDHTSPSAPERADPTAIMRVLACVDARLSYSIRQDSRFLRFGGIVVPTSPRGLDVLRAMRSHAEQHTTDPSLDVVEESSPLGTMLGALRAASREVTSGILGSARNRTTSEPTDSVFRIALGLDSRALSAMPSGTTLPPAILSPALVGYVVEDAAELGQECDMCDDGVAEFLSRFGIDHEREHSSYECGECGCEHDSDEGSGGIESCDTFELTESMVDAIDRQGFGDALRDYLGSGDSADWSTLLETCDDAEVMERCAPDAENGIRFDSSVWRFEPDFESIDGMESLEWSEVSRALPLLVRIVDAHTSARVLPPIAGVLRYQHGGTCGADDGRSRDFSWDPDNGRLSHVLGRGLALRVDARNGGAMLVVLSDGAERTVGLSGGSGSEWIVAAPAHHAGDDARIMLEIHKGSAGI